MSQGKTGAKVVKLTTLEAFLYRLTRDYGVPIYAVLDHSVIDRDGPVTNETVRDEARAFAKVLLRKRRKP